MAAFLATGPRSEFEADGIINPQTKCPIKDRAFVFMNNFNTSDKSIDFILLN